MSGAAAILGSDRAVHEIYVQMPGTGRSDGDDLGPTQDFLSLRLGVRRPGVTTAVRTLETAGLVEALRGMIAVTDRTGLFKLTDGTYGTAEAEYERLIGQPTRGKARGQPK